MLNELKDLAIEFGFDRKLVESIEFKYNNKFGWDGVLGRYCPIRKTIEIAPDIDVYVIFPTVVHELVHALQRDTMGLIPYLLSLTFHRKRIEADAEELEEQLYDIFEAEARKPTQIKNNSQKSKI
jgi:hypothetical protein